MFLFLFLFWKKSLIIYREYEPENTWLLIKKHQLPILNLIKKNPLFEIWSWIFFSIKKVFGKPHRFFFYRVIFIRFFCNSQNCIGLVYRVFKFFIGLRCIRLFNGVSKSIGLKYRVLVVYRVFEIEPNFLELKKPCKIGDQINTGVGKKSKKKK